MRLSDGQINNITKFKLFLKGTRGKEEDEILTLKEAAIKPTAHSRLGCQVELKKECNNITVTIAPN